MPRLPKVCDVQANDCSSLNDGRFSSVAMVRAAPAESVRAEVPGRVGQRRDAVPVSGFARSYGGRRGGIPDLGAVGRSAAAASAASAPLRALALLHCSP